MGIQVESLYKKGVGIIPDHLRPFYSFKFGGRDIEEFNLVTTFTNSKGLSQALYTTFKEYNSQYSELDGQQYYGQTMEPYHINFTLSTDGMTEFELVNFTRWFKPGAIRELILAEHPNRGIKARLLAPPQIDMTPFDVTEIKTINNKEYKFVSTCYKGNISITLIADDPFWYAIKPVLLNEELTEGEVKIMLEDSIPYVGLFSKDITNNVLLGNNYCYMAQEIKEQENYTLNSDNKLYVYNCGTAYSYPTISFTQDIKFDEEGYINVPNSYKISKECSYIKIGEQKLDYTLSPFFASYNDALKVIKEHSLGDSLLDLIQDLRENVVNYYLRAKVVGLINDEINNGEKSLTQNIVENVIAELKNYMPAQFGCEINCSTGSCITSFEVKENETITRQLKENSGDMIMSKHFKIEGKEIMAQMSTITLNECLEITSSNELKNFKLYFENRYY